MIDGRKNCVVGEIAAATRNALVGGPFGSNLISADYVPSGIPVIRGQNMGPDRWVAGEFVFVTEEKANSLAANLAHSGDLVFTQRGTLGQIALVPRTPFARYLISQSQMKLTVDPGKADTLFLYYVFSSPEMQDYIRRHAIQTGVPHTNLGILRDTPLKLPPLVEQEAIAHILGALDDKIELNRRMNETLEAMARAIFKSWFVNFDPVRAKAEGRQPFGMDAATVALLPDSFQDSSLGKIPKGWKIAKLGELVEFAYGRALKQEDRREGQIPVHGSNGQVGWHNEALVAGPGIVVGRKGNAGTVRWVNVDFYPIDTTFYVVPKNDAGNMHYFFYYLSLLDLPSLGADSAVPGLNRNIAYMSDVLVPPTTITKVFDHECTVLRNLVHKNEDMTGTLAAIRDVLLPELISGEIRVKASE